MSKRYSEHNDSMRELSKDEQQELMWAFHSDKSLQLIYPSFAAFVKARTGIVLKGASK